MTFYVYHKVKGDRFECPSYDLLDTFDDRQKAQNYADKYNDEHGYRKGVGFHHAVVRVRKAKEEYEKPL